MIASVISFHFYYGVSFTFYGDWIKLTLGKSSYWAPPLFIVLYTLRPIIFFPATILTAGAGVVFGPVYGYIYTIIGALGSAIFAYGMGRFIGSNLLEKIRGKWVGVCSGKIQEESFMTTLLMRLLYFPYDAVGYLAGVSRAKIIPFLAGTFIGILPGSATFVLLGGALGTALEGEVNPPVQLFEYEIPYKTFKIGLIILFSVVTFILSYSLSKFLKNQGTVLQVN